MLKFKSREFFLAHVLGGCGKGKNPVAVDFRRSEVGAGQFSQKKFAEML